MGWQTFDSTGATLSRSFSDTPVGTVVGYAGAAAPTGWVLCDGSAISRTDYASLFGVVGTTYGSGNGTTTFNVPDAAGFIIYALSLSERIPGVSPPSLVTSLPASPVDGAEVYYSADGTNGIVWHLRYRAASSSSYKWEYVGGPQITSGPVPAVASPFTFSGTSWVTFTGGPSVTVPLAGDYMITWALNLQNAGSQPQAYDMAGGLSVNGANPSEYGAYTISGVAYGGAHVGRTERRNALAASAVFTIRLQTNLVSTNTWARIGTIAVTPVRVG